jgi:pyruvate-ferredoxin/flavodoxin oxidoreductase
MIDSKAPSIPFGQCAYNQARYKMLAQSDEHRAEQLLALAQHDA